MMNITDDTTRPLRHTRIFLLSTLFLVGVTGCSIVIFWLIRYARWNMRSARICSLILNLILADLSVNIFATGVQIFWEFQTARQWPFNDFFCRLTKFLQSFSILSSTYLVVVMAIDRCVAITTPLKAGKIRVLYLCGSAWILSGILSTPNVFIFQLEQNATARYCTAILHRQQSRTGLRIYLTFISLVVYFIPFAILVVCYITIFFKLLWRENDNADDKDKSSCCWWFFQNDSLNGHRFSIQHGFLRSASNRSSFSDYDARRKRANTYAKARTKTFRMIIVLVLVMIVFGAPYYFMELYVIYTQQTLPLYVRALAGGAAVAPASLDPWIFLLFWANWHQPPKASSSRRLIPASLPVKNHQYIHIHRTLRSNTLQTSSSSDHRQNNLFHMGPSRSTPYVIRWNAANNRHNSS